MLQQVENVCDACGGELYQRDDDKEETVKSRLEVYEAQTAPLIEYYEQKGILHTINGDLPINEVTTQLGEALGQNWELTNNDICARPRSIAPVN